MPTQQTSAQGASGLARRIGSVLIAPPRAGLVLVLGSVLLASDGVRWLVQQAGELGEAELNRLGSWWRRDRVVRGNGAIPEPAPGELSA